MFKKGNNYLKTEKAKNNVLGNSVNIYKKLKLYYYIMLICFTNNMFDYSSTIYMYFRHQTVISVSTMRQINKNVIVNNQSFRMPYLLITRKHPNVHLKV